MTNHYNKGRFRNGEWGKHLRPYGKRRGNKRWRKSVGTVIGNEIIEEASGETTAPNRSRRPAKKIKVKITLERSGRKSSHIGKYRTMKDAHNATKRNAVIRTMILNNRDTEKLPYKPGQNKIN